MEGGAAHGRDALFRSRGMQSNASEAATLELHTDRAGLTRQEILPLAHPNIPPEPQQQQKSLEPVSEVVTLSRSRDYRLRQLGNGCPTCALYSADLRPASPDAVILRAVTVSSSGVGWHPCPARLRCGVYEFSSRDDPLISGCTGVSVCSVWRLAEAGAEASDVIQLTTQRSELACVNCPQGVDFQAAHAQWQEARERALLRCPVAADLPAKSTDGTPEK